MILFALILGLSGDMSFADVPAKNELCLEQLRAIPARVDKTEIEKLCVKIERLDGCQSIKGQPIFHYDKIANYTKGKRILTMSLIHGDEIPSGTVTLNWMSRLEKIDPRNSWRVIPISNPDGYKKKQRMNENGVDLNRNFPTKEWTNVALDSWRTKSKSDPRRYPGPHAASETETKCLLKHFEAFKPDFIISIHTPIGVLDFDGPRVAAPKTSPLPWAPLGNYPGSLGRYMWKDNNIPVLTIELKGNSGAAKLEELDRLQDISGTIAIESHKLTSGNKN